MLSGAVIGAVVGLVVALTMTSQAGLGKKFFQILRAMGPQEARRFLDQKVKPTQKVGTNLIIKQKVRMAGLACVGDVTAIAQEIAQHTGMDTAVTQVNAVGLLGIVVRTGDPGAAQKLDALATRFETEASAMFKLVKKNTRLLAKLANGVVGQPLTVEDQAAVFLHAKQNDVVTRALMQQALAIALDRAGNATKAAEIRGQVAAATNAFSA